MESAHKYYWSKRNVKFPPHLPTMQWTTEEISTIPHQMSYIKSK